jgi:hypothetical protein
MEQDVSIFLAPVIIIVGGGLIATALLTLFNYHFYKTKLQAVGALIGGLVLIAVLELMFISGNVSAGFFFENQKQQVTACELVGEAAHPDQRGTHNSSEIRQTIIGCLNDAGYEWAGDHHNCQEAPVATNPYCYLPTGLLSRAFTHVQLVFE